MILTCITQKHTTWRRHSVTWLDACTLQSRKWQNTTLHHITSHCTHYITLHHIASHCITKHHITSHYTHTHIQSKWQWPSNNLVLNRCCSCPYPVAAQQILDVDPLNCSKSGNFKLTIGPYPLVIQHSYWKWLLVVSLPIKHCDFP